MVIHDELCPFCFWRVWEISDLNKQSRYQELFLNKRNQETKTNIVLGDLEQPNGAREQIWCSYDLGDHYHFSTITNISVQIEGYPIFRLDRLGKSGAGDCAYVRHCLKGGILKDLAGIGESDLHQLWLQIQNKNRRSILLCIVYIPPDRGLSCLENELMPTYVKALSRNKDIVRTGDANCDLLLKTPKDDALRSFCTSVNARQLIDRPTRVTMTSRSLLDIVMVSNKDIVKPWGDLDLTISDHYLVYIVLDMNVPKPPPIYITTRSFKNCTADKFSVDITRVPWETVKLMASVDDRVDAFNNLFLTCLDNHATMKTLKLKRKSNPSITAVIRERINTRNKLHKRARKSGTHEEWKANK